MEESKDNKKGKQCYLNSFYFRGRFGTDPISGKRIEIQPDFLQISIKDCETGKTTLKYIEHPFIDYYLVKPELRARFTYPMLSTEYSNVDKYRCLYKDRDKEISKQLGIIDQYYEACKRGRQYDYTVGHDVDFRRQFINSSILSSPYVYMGDMNIEDYYKNLFCQKYGYDTYQKYGSFTQAFMDIEADQFKDEWNVAKEERSAPINSISYLYLPTNTLYLFVLKNQYGEPEGPAIDYVEQNFHEFVELYIKPEAHDDTLQYQGYFYDTEEDLLKGFWKIVHETRPDFCGIWNMNFDIPYILGRMKILDMNIRDIVCHPDVPTRYRVVNYIEDTQRSARNFAGKGDNTHPSRLWDWTNFSGYTQFYDMMATYSLLRKRFIFPSYKLDDIAASETGYRKLEYHSKGYTIRKFAHQNFKMFLSYSAIDTIRLKQIEAQTDDLNKFILFTDNTRLQVGFKVSIVIKNALYKLYNEGVSSTDKSPHIIGNSFSYDVMESISGAIIASPDNLRIKGKGILDSIGLIYEDIVDFDESSEYPRTIVTFNISKNSIHSRMVRIENGNGKPFDDPSAFNKLLQTRETSINEIGETYFGLPSLDELLNEIEKHV